MRMHPTSCWASRLMLQSIQVVLLHLPLPGTLFTFSAAPISFHKLIRILCTVRPEVFACKTYVPGTGVPSFLTTRFFSSSILSSSVVLCLTCSKFTIPSLSLSLDLSGISGCNCHGWQCWDVCSHHGKLCVGNSGGPAFADLQQGKVAGVAFSKLSNADNVGYIIPYQIIKHFLQVCCSSSPSACWLPYLYSPPRPPSCSIGVA